jgi:hypothetical protein
MGAYKQFTNSDVISVPFTVVKGFNFTGSSMTGSSIGIDFYAGSNYGLTLFDSASEATTGLISKYHQRSIYSSARSLYYSNNTPYYGDFSSSINLYNPYYTPYFNSPILEYTGSTSSSFGRFYNYPTTDLYQPKYISETIGSGATQQLGIISIPNSLYGNYIVPKSFKMTFYPDDVISMRTLIDDGEGNITYGTTGDVVGNIFYSHGIVVLTDDFLYTTSTWTNSINSSNLHGSGLAGITFVNLMFSSSITLYENKYNCTILENEFGFSQNPSLASGSTNTLYDFATGSYFSPYITTVGLYNDDKDLIAVAKLGQPLKCSSTTDTTIMVNFDLV